MRLPFLWLDLPHLDEQLVRRVRDRLVRGLASNTSAVGFTAGAAHIYRRGARKARIELPDGLRCLADVNITGSAASIAETFAVLKIAGFTAASVDVGATTELADAIRIFREKREGITNFEVFVRLHQRGCDDQFLMSTCGRHADVEISRRAFAAMEAGAHGIILSHMILKMVGNRLQGIPIHCEIEEGPDLLDPSLEHMTACLCPRLHDFTIENRPLHIHDLMRYFRNLGLISD